MDRGEINLLDTLKKAVSDAVAEPYSKICTVGSFSEENNTIEANPIDDTAPILNVRLISGESETPFLVIPKVGSIVAVSFLSETSAFVSMYSEIETVAIHGEQFGGLIKIEELKTQLDIVSDRLDTIYNAINNGVVTAGDGGAGLLATMKATLAGQVKKENYDKIENETVKHG